MMREKIYNILLVIIFTCVIFFGCGADDSDKINVDLKERTVSDIVTEYSTERLSISEEASEQIFVYINGAVKNSGVYCVSENARIYHVIRMAGGMTAGAYKDGLNLAEKVYDGQNIHVMTKKQYKKQKSEANQQTNNLNVKTDNEDTQNSGADISEIVNINIATAEQLTSLPGIGETKAAAIVAYRDKNGRFYSIEDIKNVSGIGEATFTNIESKITVK